MPTHEQKGSQEINEPAAIRHALEEVRRRQANNIVGSDISQEPRGSNIFMGIGLVSQRGVSPGLGFGVIPMACVAFEAQRAFDAEGLPSGITVLIADQHALEARPTEAHKIRRTADLVGQSTNRLFEFLSIRAHVVKASDSDWPKMNGQNYESLEALDILHAHEGLGCGVKVGWQTKRKSLKPDTVIRDERWFDEQARAQTNGRLNSMSFIRTSEWISLRTQLDPSSLPQKSVQTVVWEETRPYTGSVTVRRRVSVNTSPQHLPLPPYIGEEGFFLGRKIDIRANAEAAKFSQPMPKRLTEFDHSLKRILGIQERTERFAILQGLIDACAVD